MKKCNYVLFVTSYLFETKINMSRNQMFYFNINVGYNLRIQNKYGPRDYTCAVDDY